MAARLGLIFERSPHSFGNGTLFSCALDARIFGESYRAIAKVLLGFDGTKEEFESDPRRNKARRLVAHGIKMMRGGYRLLLRYPIKPH